MVLILNLPMISCSSSPIYVAAAPIYVAAALEKYQNIWIEVFRQLIIDFENGVIVKIYKS